MVKYVFQSGEGTTASHIVIRALECEFLVEQQSSCSQISSKKPIITNINNSTRMSGRHWRTV